MVHKRYRVAIVESDELIRQLIARWLGDAGHVVVGMDVASANADPGVDLVIANVSSRRHAAARIRSLKAACASRILVISASFRRDPGQSDLARQLGIHAVLPKPFTREALHEAIAQAMREDGSGASQ